MTNDIKTVEVGALDLGNSMFQCEINGEVRMMPNSLATLYSELSFYEPTNTQLFENMVVSINSPAVKNNQETYMVGLAASKETSQQATVQNNQKASEERTMILSLTMLAYEFAKDAKVGDELNVKIEMLSTALPTRQVKKGRDELKQKLIGNHKVTFKYVSDENGTLGELTVNIFIEDAIVGIEGNLAYLALTRDEETLKVKDATLTKETVLIADLGGGSLDFAAFENGKLIDDSTIAGVPYGINEYLDKISNDILDNIGYRFASRYELEEILIQGKAKWSVWFEQKEHDITKYIEPHLKTMANRFLNDIRATLRHPKLQSVRHIYTIGGSVEVSKAYINEVNNNSDNPLKIAEIDNVHTLNLRGIKILGKAQLQAKKAKQPN